MRSLVDNDKFLNPIPMKCQTTIEMSPFYHNRNVPFLKFVVVVIFFFFASFFFFCEFCEYVENVPSTAVFSAFLNFLTY